jgi:hypothetical protein
MNMERKHYKRIIKVPAKSFNDFCWKLRDMYIYDVTVRSASIRYQFIDKDGYIRAQYFENRDYGTVYDYDTHSELNGKILKFPY